MFTCSPPNTKRHCGGFSSLPKRNPNNYDGEAISAKLNELSLEERSKVEYELHGVADVREETPELLRSKVEEIDQALAGMVASFGDDTSAYEQALETSKGYVENLKVVFLRAEAYNARATAARMVRFFDRKRYLFGEEKLVKDIQLSDLETEEMNALKQGVLVVLPQRDQSGRVVVAVNGRVQAQYASTKQVMRLMFYIAMVVVQDVEGGQKRGLVAIYHAFGQSDAVPGRPIEFWKSLRALPIRIVACHYCRDDAKLMGSGIRHFFAIAERLTVCRFRCHYGPVIECMYKLMTFGIPAISEVMPIRADGHINLTRHRQMIKEWQAREEEQRQRGVTHTNPSSRVVSPGDEDDHSFTNPSPGTYVIPGNLDIVMGRGRNAKSSPGSIHFHDLVQQYREAYDTARRRDKSTVVDTVLNKLKGIGCRFIEMSPGGYQVCEDALARTKIGHGFRNLRLKDGEDDSASRRGNPAKKRVLDEKKELLLVTPTTQQ